MAHTLVCTSHDHTATVSHCRAVMEHGAWAVLVAGLLMACAAEGAAAPALAVVAAVDIAGRVAGLADGVVGDGSICLANFFLVDYAFGKEHDSLFFL